MFNQGNNKLQEGALGTIKSIKNYLPTSGGSGISISSFFDSFASKWINKVNYDTLIYSVFCTSNNELLEDSYCLRIGDKSKKSLFIFPAFFDIGKFLKNDEGLEIQDETGVEPQALKQVHDKASSIAERFNDVTYELATDPKPVIENYDERFDSKVDEMLDKKDELMASFGEIKTNWWKETKQRLLNKADRFGESSRQPTVADDDWEEEEEDSEALSEGSRDAYRYMDPEEILTNSKVKRSTFFEIEEANLDSHEVIGGLVLPLSLIRLDESIPKSPRNQHYSQVVFDMQIDSKDSAIAKRDDDEIDQECTPITWYNIFHFSIFGKTNFCEASVTI
ncbi:uncharacterized protein RJT20DRAFT_63710 [Scheffersomyces xylosifermentans]|uniref:uncharacterized protein n=1 Tax=Scheffersomyces xylosifermentans TaxID=1304137 RepID=UPI00315CAAE0